MPPFRTLDAIGVTIRRFERPVAEEPIARTMYSVGSAPGDSVDNAAHRTSKFGREAIGKHLEFLDGVLGKLAANTGSPGILVVKRFGCVVAVGKERISHGYTAKTN